jgi:hypothetical protein
VSVPARAAGLIVAFLVVVGLGVFTAIYYIGGNSALPTVHYTASGGVVNVMLQEDPQNNSSSTPDWVSYYVQDPTTKKWEHTTLFSIPANTTVHVTILGYDGCTPLRNNFYSQVQGTDGNTVSVTQFNQHGKQLGATTQESVINSWSDCNVAHSFAIPALGLYVPVASPNAQLSANNLCGTSPCVKQGNPYAVETFTFKAPTHSGTFRWQCLVPCGGGFLDGNSGPMQSIGYMMGFMDVTA